ncbi:MAG: pirin family protein, partial [Ignavibacteria bacterium]|nr:pirin family protein [Ignavibacteria bacterium]
EFNPSNVEEVHLFQIWIMPDQAELTPSYEKVTLEKDGRKNKLQLVASNTRSEGKIFISQDVSFYLADLEKGTEIKLKIEKGRGVFLQTISGELTVGNITLSKGDALEVTEESELVIISNTDAELMLFDIKI